MPKGNWAAATAMSFITHGFHKARTNVKMLEKGRKGKLGDFESQKAQQHMESQLVSLILPADILG